MIITWVVRKCLFESFAIYRDFFACQTKKKEFFCGLSWLAIRIGFILINSKRRKLDETIIHFNSRRGIFAVIRFCSIWWDQKGGCITNSCIQMKPLQLIANSSYADWETSWRKKESVINNQCKVILLHDNTRSRKTDISIELEWEVLSHLAYSPDLALLDYDLFSVNVTHLRIYIFLVTKK